MTGYTPETLTLAACRSLGLDVSGGCDGCSTVRQWVGARATKLDEVPISRLWSEGRFKCARCGQGMCWLEIRERGNTLQAGEVLARYGNLAIASESGEA